MWLAGNRLSDEARLDEVGLLVGAQLSLYPPPSTPPAPASAPDAADARHGAGPVGTGGGAGASGAGGWELAVVGGVHAGAAAPLGAGLTVGRDRCSGLHLADPEVSRSHCAVVPGPDAVRLRDSGSRNGVSWRGYRLADSADLDDGDVFGVGESLVALRRIEPADAVTAADPATGTLRFNRPPRLARPTPPPVLAVPAAPAAPRGARIPLLAALAPLVIAGLVYALAPGAGYYLIFLALSPILLLANAAADRRSGRREHRQALAAHQREIATLTAELDRLATVQGRQLRAEYPDPAAVLRTATAPTHRLYERRPADADFLRLRVGLADAPVAVRLAGDGADTLPLPRVPAAPVTVDLPAVGVLGLAGRRPSLLAAARAALGQLAALHAPDDLHLVVLTGRDQATDWEWAGWLPHTLGGNARRRFAVDAGQAAARLAELRQLIATRRDERRASLGQAVPAGARVLVVLDGARRLRDLDGLAEILAEGPACGVYALCLDDQLGDLPDECGATLEVTTDSGTRARLSAPGTEPVAEILLDGVPEALATDLARALAPVRLLGGRGDQAALPDSVRLLELTGLGDDPDPTTIARRWAAGRTEPPRVLLGVGPAGPVRVDLRRDGPHALIAGTSGAGKSELLQTLVAELALRHPPDALSLVLVDYKGGSAFGACRDLPHCAGLVTDLDAHLVNRALESLSAELRRREALLAAADAKDIDDFLAPAARLPRLVIVVDEFASLVAEVPDFVTGVVGIGMRGRSLGVHLVLATQRPAGVVSAELRANVNLRICLRVTSVEDSRDVIDAADAARLSRRLPGRAYLRTGHGELAALQTARINAPRRGSRLADRSVTVVPRPVTELGAPLPAPVPDAGHDGETDLSVLVTAIGAAAEVAGCPAAPSPWLPPLPEQVTVAQLGSGEPSGGPVAVPIGLADHPRQQVQRPYLLDLAASGPVAVAGMARSGRSTLLRTLAAGLADRSGPADVHLYVLDLGNRALAPLADLPHTGAYVTGDEPDRASRLLSMMDGEVRARQRRFAAGGYADLAEQRTGPDPLPYLVLLVDGYEALAAAGADPEAGRRVDALDGLLRAGPAVGVLVVLATDASGFTHRLAGAVATRLVLRHADRDDLAGYGIVPRDAPTHLPPGRVLPAPDGPHLQVALLSPQPDGAAQSEAVRRLAAVLRARWDGTPADRLPRRLDPLPTEIELAELTVDPAGAVRSDRPATTGTVPGRGRRRPARPGLPGPRRDRHLPGRRPGPQRAQHRPAHHRQYARRPVQRRPAGGGAVPAPVAAARAGRRAGGTGGAQRRAGGRRTRRTHRHARPAGGPGGRRGAARRRPGRPGTGAVRPVRP